MTVDAFEALVGMLLERQGYWIRSGVKVELSKEEKRQIGKFSSPRWELDIVAYKGSDNSLLVVECKSFLDSRGVTAAALAGPAEGRKDRYKLFRDRRLRDVIFRRLKTQLIDAGFCGPSPKTTLCLVAGHALRVNKIEPCSESTSKHRDGGFGMTSGYVLRFVRFLNLATITTYRLLWRNFSYAMSTKCVSQRGPHETVP